MVYCGKPSKACQHCRKRKLRCDLRKEGCSQCKRAKLSCYGYRDTDELRVRDQTHSVSQKIVKQGIGTRPTTTITVSLKDRARSAFFSNYVFDGSKSYDFLGPFYSSTAVDEPLFISLEAVSLAFFAHQENTVLAFNEGRNRYNSALSRVKQAVSCPTTAKKDSTLLATMLLDLYEKITNVNPESCESWKIHVRGSLALVGLRGPQQYQDRNVFRMLMRLSINLLITCVATNTPLPADLVTLRNCESEYLDNKDPKWLLTDLMLSYVNLRELISNGQLTDRNTVDSLLTLDADFADIAVKSPDSWQCRKVWLCSPTERVLGDHIDVFLDYHITQTRNVSRLIRILLNEVLREYSSSPAGLEFSHKEGLSLRNQAEENINKLVDEICASTPQYTCPELAQTHSESPSPSDFFSPKESGHMSVIGIRMYTPAAKVRAYSLIFPLYVAGQSGTTAERQKLWIINQLHFMAGSMGIKNAEVVAKILEAGVKMNPWKVYALLGSYAFAA